MGQLESLTKSITRQENYFKVHRDLIDVMNFFACLFSLTSYAIFKENDFRCDSFRSVIHQPTFKDKGEKDSFPKMSPLAYVDNIAF